MKEETKQTCNAPGGKCIKPAVCKAKGSCILAKKPRKPGQVTGQKKGY